MNPCGRIVDFTRNCFRATMRPDPDNAVGDFEVEWFRVPLDREPLGEPTVFGSSTWDDWRFPETVGELRESREWVSGKVPLVQPAADPPGLCGTAAQWLDGWPVGTPGCEVDPHTGLCKACGPVAAPQRVTAVWRVADPTGGGEVVVVHGCGQGWSVGLTCPAAAVEGCLSFPTVEFPEMVAVVEGVGALVLAPTPCPVAMVEGVAEYETLDFVCPVAVVIGVKANAVFVLPFSVGVVEGVAAKLRGDWRTAAPVGVVEGVQSYHAFEFPCPVAWVEGCDTGDVYPGVDPVSYVYGAEGGFGVKRPTAAAEVYRVFSLDNATGEPIVRYVYGAGSIEHPGARGPAIVVEGVESVYLEPMSGAAAEVYEPAQTLHVIFAAPVAMVESAADKFQARLIDRLSVVEGCNGTLHIIAAGVVAFIETAKDFHYAGNRNAAAVVQACAGKLTSPMQGKAQMVEGVKSVVTFYGGLPAAMVERCMSLNRVITPP